MGPKKEIRCLPRRMKEKRRAMQILANKKKEVREGKKREKKRMVKEELDSGPEGREDLNEEST